MEVFASGFADRSKELTMLRFFAFITCGIAAALAVLTMTGMSFAATALPAPTIDVPLANKPGAESAVVAGGCFWGVEAVFKHVKAVTQATSGYSGGDANSATYEKVSSGSTGHAESVRVTYDPSRITYGQLLKYSFRSRTILLSSTAKGLMWERNTGLRSFTRTTSRKRWPRRISHN
jgi:hypothetical protein